MTPLTSFVDVLALDPVGDDGFAARTPGTGGHLFGGLTFGLAARAAALTLDDDRTLYAATCQYIGAGTGGMDLAVEVERVRDGRQLSLRRVRVLAGDRMLFGCDAWFAPTGEGDDWQEETPEDDFDAAHSTEVIYGLPVDPIEVRTPRNADEVSVMRIHPYWARSREAMGDDPTVQLGALSFLSDVYTVGLTSFPGLAPSAPRTDYTLTLNHNLWIHRPFDLGEWTRVDGRLVSISRGRALVSGSIHDRSGCLVASFAQESTRRG